MANLIDLSSTYTLIQVIGDKAETFLQGQLTADMQEVSLTQTRLSAHCNAKGRVLSSFRVLQYHQQYYLCAPCDMTTHIIAQLAPYAQLSRIQLKPNPQLSVMGIWDVDYDTPQHPDEAISENDLCLIKLHGPTPCFVAIGPKDQVISSILQTHPDIVVSHDPEAWALLGIRAGVAMIHPETSGLFTPDMLNYPALNAVSFKKGCYIGQEIIARTHYLGKGKRHLTYSQAPTDPRPDPTIVSIAFDAQRKVCEFLAVS